MHDTEPSPAPELHGIDVSHHNRPDWGRIARTSQFCWCRATYGTMRDRLVASHVAAARQSGLQVGLYHFFRPTQDADEQADAFLSVCDSVGIGDGSLVHALDVEADTYPNHQPVSKGWEPRVRRVADLLSQDAGQSCVVYTTQREWSQLGNPTWIRNHPLWVAHWIGTHEPTTPLDCNWAIHQYRVGTYDPWESHHAGGPTQLGALDHNRARQPLPTIRTTPVAPVRKRVEVALIPLASDYHSRSEARDEYIRSLEYDE